MSDLLKDPLSEIQNAGRRFLKGLSRRRMLVGSVGIAGVAASMISGRAQPNTQRPVAPRHRPNRWYVDRSTLYASKLIATHVPKDGVTLAIDSLQ